MRPLAGQRALLTSVFMARALLRKQCGARRGCATLRSMSQSRRPSARERARVEMADEIKRTARRRLAADGVNLSLRAVARDLGVAPTGSPTWVTDLDTYFDQQFNAMTTYLGL